MAGMFQVATFAGVAGVLVGGIAVVLNLKERAAPVMSDLASATVGQSMPELEPYAVPYHDEWLELITLPSSLKANAPRVAAAADSPAKPTASPKWPVLEPPAKRTKQVRVHRGRNGTVTYEVEREDRADRVGPSYFMRDR